MLIELFALFSFFYKVAALARPVVSQSKWKRQNYNKLLEMQQQLTSMLMSMCEWVKRYEYKDIFISHYFWSKIAQTDKR